MTTFKFQNVNKDSKAPKDSSSEVAPTRKRKVSKENQRCEICNAPISSIELECSHGLNDKNLGEFTDYYRFIRIDADYLNIFI